jgi:hypothetical protein
MDDVPKAAGFPRDTDAAPVKTAGFHPWKNVRRTILSGTAVAGGGIHVTRGSELPMPRRRTLTAPHVA